MTSIEPPPFATCEASLHALLSDIFNAEGLRRFITLRYGPIARELPTNGSLTDLAFSATLLLRQHGLITASLFGALIEERPAQRRKILACAASWQIDSGVIGVAPTAPTRRGVVAWSGRLLVPGMLAVLGAAAVLAVYKSCELLQGGRAHACEVVPPTIESGGRLTGGVFHIKEGHTVELRIVETGGAVTGLRFDCLTSAAQGSLELYLADGAKLQIADVTIPGGGGLDLGSIRVPYSSPGDRDGGEPKSGDARMLKVDGDNGTGAEIPWERAQADNGARSTNDATIARSIKAVQYPAGPATSERRWESVRQCTIYLMRCACVMDPAKCKLKLPETTVAECEDLIEAWCWEPGEVNLLPDRLEPKTLVDRLRPARQAATIRCGAQSRRDELIQIKLSLNGKRGRVVAWDILESSGNLGLAECLARELEANVQLPPVGQPLFGAQATFDFRQTSGRSP